MTTINRHEKEFCRNFIPNRHFSGFKVSKAWQTRSETIGGSKFAVTSQRELDVHSSHKYLTTNFVFENEGSRSRETFSILIQIVVRTQVNWLDKEGPVQQI